MEHYKKYLPHILIAILFTSAFGVWYFIFVNSHNNNYLKVAFLDVGQGDAIYIEAPNGKQMLIDGGPDSSVLPRLAKEMPFADRSIDMLVVTNPDQDHIAGLIDVINNYKVDMILEPGTEPNSQIYKKLEKEITDHKVRKEIARRGMHIILDQEKNIYFDILFPDRDVSNWETNDASIVGHLVYGNESFMLMGDATKYTENLIKWNENPDTLHSQVLKLGHHGSHSSSSILWFETVHPDIAIISAGKNNRYGHPHKDVLDNLKSLNIPYLGTYQSGSIVFETDGVGLQYKK